MHTFDGRRLNVVANSRGFIRSQMQNSQLCRDCSEGLLPNIYILTKKGEGLLYVIIISNELKKKKEKKKKGCQITSSCSFITLHILS